MPTLHASEQQTSHLNFLLQHFLGALLVKPVQAGELLNISKQSGCILIHPNRFPIPQVIDSLGCA